MFIQRIVFVAAALVVVPAAFGAASDQLPEFMQEGILNILFRICLKAKLFYKSGQSVRALL